MIHCITPYLCPCWKAPLVSLYGVFLTSFLKQKESTVKKYNYTSWKEETKEETKINSGVNDEERTYEDRLVKACTMGQLEVIQEYIEQEHDVNKFLYTGWTLLLYAISSVEPEIVEYLLVQGANPNRYTDGFTPLMALCNSTKGTSENSMKCLELLIQAKADANVTNKHKLDLTDDHNFYRETALMYACMSKDANFIFELIKYALMYAASANKPDNVQILLVHHANTSQTDSYNLSAKDIADTKGFSEISALLNEDEEEVQTFCEISNTTTWKDLFPNLYPRKKEFLDYDISVMLHGMGLEKYGNLFQGIDIKTFLQLTEDDLCRIGVDITVHRDQFLENLEKFHSRRWLMNSFGKLRKTDSYTIYDGVISLTNAKKQIGVIASSFQYIKNNLLKAANENTVLSSEKRIEYEEELRKTQKTLKLLKNEIIQVKKLAQQINKENNIGVPAIWISPKSTKSNWTITISITLMIGLYLCKKMYVQRLWNICNIRISSILRFRTHLSYFFE
ncbi:Ankyrin repeat, SAM and basic leucine zipper domain-containing protein 1 [Trachymyrmex zeteki]|uniref:Ankyrin repeat, SAM and basic leucine zipper domain-containing protein 1 n=1 Tax=Mycetomoellerius zeteki TaxID=64791 RepID=A0A151WRR1_9HYME|nr:Ankyrin repeat, SAM and basic leucine zipper domain-containing protein 1 [Trachymyrmex zeteki]